MPEQRPQSPTDSTSPTDSHHPTEADLAHESGVLFDLQPEPGVSRPDPADVDADVDVDAGPPTDPGSPTDIGPPTDPGAGTDAPATALLAPLPRRPLASADAQGDSPARRTSVHPGLVLDTRYQLQHPVSDRDGIELWYGEDRVLARPVAIRLVLESGDGRTGSADGPTEGSEGPGDDLIEAARRSGQLVHSGAASTYDATRTDADGLQIAYVVSEWVAGISLLDLLRDGPLLPERAAAITLAVARVIWAGQSVGVSHGDLHPGDVIITAHGLIKVIDLEMRAIARPYDAAARRARDTEGLGAILYACLTGRWPLGPGRGLPAAEYDPSGHLRSPRQLRAGVPRELDALAMAALGHGAGTPPGTGDLVGALEVIVAELPTGSQPALDDDPEAGLPAAQRAKAEQAERLALASQARQRTVRRRVVPIVLLVVLALAAWLIGVGVGRIPGRSGSGATPGNNPVPQSTGRELALSAATVNDFDPQGDTQENPADVPLAYDADLRTAWSTEQYYGSQWAGSLTKKGVGLRVDFAEPVDVTQVRLTFGEAGVVAELRWSDTPSVSLDGYTVAANTSPAGQAAAVQTLVPRTGAHRYWLVWLTQLPKVSDDRGGAYAARLEEMAFYG